MGRHKLPYKLKKPNPHHKYWRYVLSSDPHRSEISTKTKVKYEAERIAKEAYQAYLNQKQLVVPFGEYAKDFFTQTCKLTQRKRSTNKSYSHDMLKVKRSQLQNYLLPRFKDTPLNEITPILFEDWRITLPLANSTKNSITIVMKQILNEAVRDSLLSINPLQQVETLSKIADNPRDSLTLDDMKKLFPLDPQQALTVWRSEKYIALMFLLVSSGMRSGEVRALTWRDVEWEDSGLLITKAIKNSGEIGTVKEKKVKFVRIPSRTLEILRQWKLKTHAPKDDDFIFPARGSNQPMDRRTISDNFKLLMVESILECSYPTEIFGVIQILNTH